MNDRIKELAIQAGAEQVATNPDGEFVKYITPEMEKFAELIIKECVDLFPDNLNSMRDYTGTACRWMIKEHFGVK